METKDSFHTFGYKGGFIHTCCNRDTGKTEVKVQLWEGDKCRPANTVIGAKCLITRNNLKRGKP